MEVGKSEKTKTMLKKFTLGNLEKKRLRVLIWGKKVIEKIGPLIREGNVSISYLTI